MTPFGRLRTATWLGLTCVAACGSGARSPERDACYLEAEDQAFQRGVAECAAYDSTDACPGWQAIEAELQREQEGCPK